MGKKGMLLLLALLLCGCAKREPLTQTTMPTVPVVTMVETTAETQVPTEPPLTEPEEEALVRVADYLPGVRQHLYYATEENFTRQVIYDFQDAYLRYGTVKKLALVREDLALLGLDILIWDGFRPVAAQFRLWEICPDPTYVADPTRGHSSHSRGNTVDLTLVDSQGQELEMPTGFDDFSAQADRDYSDCTQTAASNARILEALMEKHGFRGYAGEWWHFTDTVEYPVEEMFQPDKNN